MAIMENLQVAAIKQAYAYLDKDPDALAGMVERSGAHSTDLQCPEDVRELSEKCREKAECWKPAADRLWACGRGCPGCESGSRAGR